MIERGYSCGFVSLARRILLVLQLWAAVSAERPLPLQPGSSQGQRQTNRKKVGHSPSATSLSAGNVRSLQVTSKNALISLTSSEGKIANDHEKESASKLEPKFVAKGAAPVEIASATIAPTLEATTLAAATTASPLEATTIAAATTASPATNAEPAAPTAAPVAVADAKPHEAPKAEAKVEAPKAAVVAPESESVKDMDREKIMQLVPEIKDFQTSLQQRFSGPSSGQCLAVDGPDYKYGCGWKPADRSNITVKDLHSPVCGCQTWFSPLQRCWQPDISTFLGYFEQGDLLTATEIGKAYFAGRCYTPFYTWLILLSFVICLGCGGSRTLRDKMKDPRLIGSALDPNRNAES